ncbi:ankyrin repeat-containing domain protein [Pyronema omphalodes]|nr:ankyrin repeat-containing domain protein [Pyronema omphalodes]
MTTAMGSVFPAEVWILIGENSNSGTLLSLFRLNRFYHSLFRSALYRTAVQTAMDWRCTCPGDPCIHRCRCRTTNPVLWAIENGHHTTVEALFQYGINPNTELAHNCQMSPWSLFSYAVNMGHVNVVRCFLDAGANVHDQNETQPWWNKQFPLSVLKYAAAQDKSVKEIVQLLLERGADATASQDIPVAPALSWVAGNFNYPETVTVARLMVKYGADVNYCDAFGLTALLTAASHDVMPMVEFLLKNGADPHLGRTMTRGHDALFWAVKNENLEMVKMLLEHGAWPNTYDNIHRRNRPRETPIHAMLRRAKSRHLKKKGYIINLDILKMLLEYGFDASVRDQRKGTIVHYVFGDPSIWGLTGDMIKTIIEIVDLRDFYEVNTDGITGLQAAEMLGDLELLDFIKKRIAQASTSNLTEAD